MCNKDDWDIYSAANALFIRHIKQRSLVSLEALSAEVLFEVFRQPHHVVVHRNPLDELLTRYISLVALAPD